MNANGISPVIAVILTVLVAALTVVLFATGHPVWGVIVGLICIDFFADMILSFKSA